ncbi:Cation transporter [Akanthomyces lecanii RCEF 1005]|uniref:Cation transporter n=1 Tax=Akanthomyces lecanii RCEF 1005 TaxID=1081108 RepID=A0A168GVA3_CORDF|nr:Cation transporter [Akanthomyces lecanii RCEF 1005]
MGALASTRRHLPAELNFITIHYCYFIVVCLLSSAVFWASSSQHGGSRISYIDSLFVVVSAMTEAGLNTVNLSTMTTWQQTMLFLLIICGSTIWVSIGTVVARKLVFHRRFVRAQPRRPDVCMAGRQSVRGAAATDREASTEDRGTACVQPTSPDENVAEEEEQARPQACAGPCSLNQAPASLETEEEGLTDTKSRRVCGCEYRALELLSIVVPLYFFLWQLLGCLALGAWMHRNMPDTALANGINPWWLGVFNGVSAFNNSGMSLLDANMMPFQGAYFVLITMGLMILAGNTAYPIFLRFIFWSGLAVLDWTTEAAKFQSTKLAVRLLLKDPRRIYTNLFPSRLTWWLLFMLICLNTADWVLFEVLNLHNPVVGSIPVGPRVLVGLFQALAVRSGGFYVVPIAQISIGVQFLYVIMMYIAVYPVVITIRQSNVYTDNLFHNELANGIHAIPHAALPRQANISHPSENGSLATAYETQPALAAPTDQSTLRRRLSHSVTPPTDTQTRRLHTASQGDERPREKRPSFHTRPFSSHGASPHATYDSHMGFIHQQLHGQLAHDIWLLVLAVLVIVIIESNHFNADPVNFSVFNIIFEVVSAYGTVGISVGTPTAAYSFAGTWYAGSKLVLCLVMLRGRHRGLPTALDHAIRLPGHHLNCKHYDVEDK